MKKSNTGRLVCLLALCMSFSLKTSAQQNAQSKPREKGAVVFDIPGTDNVIVKMNIQR